MEEEKVGERKRRKRRRTSENKEIASFQVFSLADSPILVSKREVMSEIFE